MKLKKTLSAILSIITLFTLIPSFSAHAAEEDEIVLGRFEENEFYDTITDAEYVPPDLIKDLTLREEDIPESMKNTNLRETNAVIRLKNKEDDLSVVKYLNSDGTISDYIMAENVKYEKDGITYDKTNRLEFSLLNGGYTNPDNDINVNFPLIYNNNNGVKLNYEKYSIEILPEKQPSLFSSFPSKETDEQGDYIVYYDVFGENIDVEYHSCFSGVKDNIILNEKPSTNEYVFAIKTNGLVVDETGKFYDGNDLIFTIGELIIFDSNGKIGTGRIAISEVEFANIYKYTISVDSDYLNDDDTVYPVVVDPIITTYSATGLTCINLKQDSTSVNTSSHYLLLGMSDNGTKYNRVFIRSNKLTVYASRIASSNVKNAYVYLYCYYANSPSGSISFTSHPITEDWDETPTVTSTLINSIGSVKDINSFNTSLYYQYYAFSIKNLFKYLIDCNDMNTRSRGFALKLLNETVNNYATFASSKETSSTLRPYIVIIKEQSGSGVQNTLENKKLYKAKNFADTSKYLLKLKNVQNNSYYLNYGSDTLSDPSTENKSPFLTFHEISDSVYAMSFISSKEENKRIFVTCSGQQSTSPTLVKVTGTPTTFSSAYKWYVLFNSTQLSYIFISYSQPYYHISINNTVYDGADKWYVEPVGLDVPLIMQEQSNWCGAASLFQIIDFWGKKDYINGNEPSYQERLFNIVENDGAADIYKMREEINQSKYHTPCDYQVYNKILIQNTINMTEYIVDSLTAYQPVILLFDTQHLAHYYPKVQRHFACIVGYDSTSNIFILRDCNNTYVSGNYAYFGEYTATATEIYTNQNYPYILCKDY